MAPLQFRRESIACSGAYLHGLSSPSSDVIWIFHMLAHAWGRINCALQTNFRYQHSKCALDSILRKSHVVDSLLFDGHLFLPLSNPCAIPHLVREARTLWGRLGGFSNINVTLVCHNVVLYPQTIGQICGPSPSFDPRTQACARSKPIARGCHGRLCREALMTARAQ